MHYIAIFDLNTFLQGQIIKILTKKKTKHFLEPFDIRTSNFFLSNIFYQKYTQNTQRIEHSKIQRWGGGVLSTSICAYDGGVIVFALSVWNFAHNFWVLSNRSLIFQMCIPCVKTFLLAPKFLILWTWL